MDDIGFVYILSQQQENFLHELAKNKMEFVPMYETDVIFIPEASRLNFMIPEKRKFRLEELEDSVLSRIIRTNSLILVLCRENAFQWRDLDISVLTNSDYIMEKMLKNNQVSNVSGSYLSENKKGTTRDTVGIGE